MPEYDHGDDMSKIHGRLLCSEVHLVELCHIALRFMAQYDLDGFVLVQIWITLGADCILQEAVVDLAMWSFTNCKLKV